MGMVTDALSDALGVPLEGRTDNASPDQRPRREDLDAALLSKLLACNVEDYKLWTYVVERTWCAATATALDAGISRFGAQSTAREDRRRRLLTRDPPEPASDRSLQ